MSVRLRHAQSGYFYAGPRKWVADARKARDLENLESAIETGRSAEFRGIHLEACVGDEEYEWVLSLRPGESGYRKVLHAETWIARNHRHRFPKPNRASKEPHRS